MTNVACHHRGAEPAGTVETAFGTEPTFACSHPRHDGVTPAHCLLCPDMIPVQPKSPAPAPAQAKPQPILKQVRDPWAFRAPPSPRHPRNVVVDRYGNDAGVADLYYGASAFLILGGPSVATMPIQELGRRGVLMMAVNNCPAQLNNPGGLPYPLRPHVWLHTDPTGKFHSDIWRDPGILKIVPVREWKTAKADRFRGIFRKVNGEFLHVPNVRGMDMPGVLGFNRNTAFDPETYLFEPSINRGNDKEHAEGDPGKKIKANGWPQCINTMFAAVRLAFYLGITRLYLVGADFRMEPGKPYGFDEGKHAGGVKSNNHTYAKMCAMFDALKPKFDAAGFEVMNCTENSGLWTFDHIPLMEAIEEATGTFQQQLDTRGWYRND